MCVNQFIRYFKRDLPALSKAGLPVVTFSSDITLHYNGDDIRIMHLPAAHTDGDAAAYFVNENVIVTGDTVFNGRYPFIDTEHGGSIKGMIAAIDAFLDLANDETMIVPGHGELMNRRDLEAYRQALATISSRVETAVKEGKNLEQLIAARPSQEYDGTMGKDMIKPDDFITILYEDLVR